MAHIQPDTTVLDESDSSSSDTEHLAELDYGSIDHATAHWTKFLHVAYLRSKRNGDEGANALIDRLNWQLRYLENLVQPSKPAGLLNVYERAVSQEAYRVLSRHRDQIVARRQVMRNCINHIKGDRHDWGLNAICDEVYCETFPSVRLYAVKLLRSWGRRRRRSKERRAKEAEVLECCEHVHRMIENGVVQMDGPVALGEGARWNVRRELWIWINRHINDHDGVWDRLVKTFHDHPWIRTEIQDFVRASRERLDQPGSLQSREKRNWKNMLTALSKRIRSTTRAAVGAAQKTWDGSALQAGDDAFFTNKDDGVERACWHMRQLYACNRWGEFRRQLRDLAGAEENCFNLQKDLQRDSNLPAPDARNPWTRLLGWMQHQDATELWTERMNARDQICRAIHEARQNGDEDEVHDLIVQNYIDHAWCRSELLALAMRDAGLPIDGEVPEEDEHTEDDIYATVRKLEQVSMEDLHELIAQLQVIEDEDIFKILITTATDHFLHDPIMKAWMIHGFGNVRQDFIEKSMDEVADHLQGVIDKLERSEPSEAKEDNIEQIEDERRLEAVARFLAELRSAHYKPWRERNTIRAMWREPSRLTSYKGYEVSFDACIDAMLNENDATTARIQTIEAITRERDKEVAYWTRKRTEQRTKQQTQRQAFNTILNLLDRYLDTVRDSPHERLWGMLQAILDEYPHREADYFTQFRLRLDQTPHQDLAAARLHKSTMFAPFNRLPAADQTRIQLLIQRIAAHWLCLSPLQHMDRDMIPRRRDLPAHLQASCEAADMRNWGLEVLQHLDALARATSRRPDVGMCLLRRARLRWKTLHARRGCGLRHVQPEVVWVACEILREKRARGWRVGDPLSDVGEDGGGSDEESDEGGDLDMGLGNQA